MRRTPAADDFETIRARVEELRREKMREQSVPRMPLALPGIADRAPAG